MVSGVIFLIAGIVLHSLIPAQIKTFETGPVNAQTVPTLLIRALIVLSVLLLAQGVLSRDKKEYCIAGALLSKETLAKLKPLLYIAMLLAYAAILPHVGFVISSLLLSNGILLYFGARKWWFYAIASANVLIAYFAFQAMSVSLP